MKFLFAALDPSGRWVSGEVEAKSPDEARRILSRRGLDWAQLKRQQNLQDWFTRLQLLLPPRLSDLALATRQMAVMLNAGLDVMRTLEVLQLGDYGPRINLAWQDLARSLRRGYPMGKAMARHPGVFSPVYLGLVHAGENSGGLVTNLNVLAEHLEREVRLGHKVQAALTYPFLVLLVCLGSVLLLTQKVLPTLIQGTLSEAGVALPWMTQALVWLGRFLNSGWFWRGWFPAAVLGLFFLGHYLRTPAGRYRCQWLMRRLPGVRRLQAASTAARFCRTMAALNACGLNLLPSLELTQVVLDDSETSRALDEVILGIEEGQTLSQMLAITEALPALVIGFTELAEETGHLSRSYEALALMLEEDIDFILNDLVTALEPLMIGVMGLIVGFIVIAMFLPLYQVLGAVG